MSVQNLAQKRHRLRKLRGETAYIDASPARLHLATLVGAGWSLRSIAGTSNVPATTISRLHRGLQTNAAPATLARILAVRPGQVPTATTTGSAEPFVSRVGTVRRIQALLWMGWGHQQMYDHSGKRTSCLLNQQGRWVTRSTHDAIADMYRDLAHQRGPSSKAATYAQKLGYASPLDWDDIDHDAEPDVEEAAEGLVDEVAIERAVAGGEVRLNKAERAEVIRRLAAQGLSDAHIGGLLGIVSESVLRSRQRHDIESQWSA